MLSLNWELVASAAVGVVIGELLSDWLKRRRLQRQQAAATKFRETFGIETLQSIHPQPGSALSRIAPVGHVDARRDILDPHNRLN